MELLPVSDLKAREGTQLVDDLGSLRKELLNLRFEQVSAQIQDTSRIKKVRRGIARVKTVLRLKTVLSRSGSSV